MRTVKQAYDIVQKNISNTVFFITNCLDLGDSFVFHLGNDYGAFIPSIQVFKSEKIEPDFYKGDFFADCEEGKINYKVIPLENIKDSTINRP